MHPSHILRDGGLEPGRSTITQYTSIRDFLIIYIYIDGLTQMVDGSRWVVSNPSGIAQAILGVFINVRYDGEVNA